MYDNSDLHKIQLAADFPEGNCYINRGVSAFSLYYAVLMCTNECVWNFCWLFTLYVINENMYRPLHEFVGLWRQP